MRIRRAARALLSLSCLAALVGIMHPGSAWADAPKGDAPGAGATPDASKPTQHASASAAKTPSKQAPKATAKANKPAPKASSKATAKPKKGGGKHAAPAPRKPGSEPGEPDEATRRIIAGTAGHAVHESEELRAMRELDLALFPSAAPSAGEPWLAEGTPLLDHGAPRVSASGMPPSPLLMPQPSVEAPKDLSWLRKLNMPDIPVRWDARVIRYLEYYKNTPRGRSMVTTWIRKSGRYGAAIRRILREQNLPEDILWLALVESGFDPTIRSPVGAAGLWQFMPEGARIYGLTVDRWVDERLDPERSTLAAARYLADLHQRFGSWELAFAAYNMGYGGLLASIRKYNTNDFWELSRLEAGMPYETALYVPKIVAMAIVARNKAVFGCEDVELDPAIHFDKVAINAGVSLRAVALAAGAPLDAIESLNPQLAAGRAPPLDPASKERSFTVRVPPGMGARAAQSLGKFVEQEGKLQRYRVRWGESVDDIAHLRGVSRQTIMSLNGLRRDEVIRPGTVIFVPAAAGTGVAVAENLIAEAPPSKPVVVVPGRSFSYPDRKRVFYRAVAGDSLRDVASLFGVSADEICRWNMIDPRAVLHEGMTLQIFTPKRHDTNLVFALEEKDATVLAAGSPEFVTHFEAQRGRARLELAAKEGDNWRTIAKRHGLTIGQVERINQRSRSSAITPGDKYVVYVPASRANQSPPTDDKPDEAVAVASPVGDEQAPAKEEEGGTRPAVLRRVIEDDDKPDEKAAEIKPGHALPSKIESGARAEKPAEKAEDKKVETPQPAPAEKPAEAKPSEKTADVKPVEKAAEAKPGEKTVESKPAEKKTVEAKPSEKKAAEAKPVEKAAEAKPSEKTPDAKPSEKKAAEAKPVEKAAEAKPSEKTPDAKPSEKSAEAKPTPGDAAVN